MTFTGILVVGIREKAMGMKLQNTPNLLNSERIVVHRKRR